MISIRRGNAIRLLYAEAQLIMLGQVFSPDRSPEAEAAGMDQTMKKFEDLQSRINEAGISYLSRWFLFREIDSLAKQAAGKTEPK